jgi:hypothetical protein
MDNLSVHGNDRAVVCLRAGDKLSYPLLCALDLNWIEEFLETFSGKQWQECEDNPYQDFELFLRRCFSIVGGRILYYTERQQIDLARFYGHLFKPNNVSSRLRYSFRKSGQIHYSSGDSMAGKWRSLHQDEHLTQVLLRLSQALLKFEDQKESSSPRDWYRDPAGIRRWQCPG